jgi:hypothetical protein
MPQVMDRRSGSAAGRFNKKQDRPDPSPPTPFKGPVPVKAPSSRPQLARGAQVKNGPQAAQGTKPEPEILFQKYFKSVGPRTYAAQLKKAGNGNHFLVLTEGKRDDKTAEVRKTRLFIYSEDFVAFFRMLHETAKFIRENPLPDEIRQKRERYWAKQSGKPGAPQPTNGTKPINERH